MEYDKEFEEMIGSTVIDSGWTMKDRLWAVWQAARKDHYRIGENAQGSIDGEKWFPVMIVAKDKAVGFIYEPQLVRRIPEKKQESPIDPLYKTLEEISFAMHKIADTMTKAVDDGMKRAKKKAG